MSEKTMSFLCSLFTTKNINKRVVVVTAAVEGRAEVEIVCF